MLGYLSELYHSYVNKPNKFYYLSLIKDDNDNYTIHGLWPQYSLNSYPSYCRVVKFELKKITPIIDKLNEYWYSNTGKNVDFWKHEYEKHGSCMFNHMDEFNYFNKSIELYEYALNNNIIKNQSEKNPNSKKLLIAIDKNFNFI